MILRDKNLIFWIVLFLISFIHVVYGLHLFGDGAHMLKLALNYDPSFLATNDFRPISHILNETPVWLALLVGIKNFQVLSWIYGLTIYLLPLGCFYFLSVKFKKYEFEILLSCFLINFFSPVNKVSEFSWAFIFFIAVVLGTKVLSKWKIYVLILFSLLSHQAIFIAYIYFYGIKFLKSKKIEYIITIVIIAFVGSLSSIFVNGKSARNLFFENFIQSFLNLNYFVAITVPMILFLVAFIFYFKYKKNEYSLSFLVMTGVYWIYFVFSEDISGNVFFIRPLIAFLLPLVVLWLFSKPNVDSDNNYIVILLILIINFFVLDKQVRLISFINEKQANENIAINEVLQKNFQGTLPKCPLFEHSFYYYQAHFWSEIKLKVDDHCSPDWSQINCYNKQLIHKYGVKIESCNL